MSSHWTKKKFFYFFGAAAGILGAACTPNFAAPSQVTDLRVLAIESDPAEAQYDGSSVDPVHLRILAVDPVRAGAFAVMTWDVCAPTDSRRCIDGPIVPQASGSQSRQGGTEFSADILVPAQLVSALVGNDKLGGFGGVFRAQFSISVDDGDPNAPVFADKAVTYSPRGTVPNHNPLLTGVLVTLAGEPPRTLAPGEVLQVQRGVQYGIRPILADGAREGYDTTDLRGNPVHLVEDPSYSFFTTPGGEFDRDTAFEPTDGVAPPEGLTRFDAFDASLPGSTLWIVVRDGRGGESWIALPWQTL